MALELLQTLLDVSERAATIARLIRGEKVLFDSLIEEKDNDFIHHDYKTFADVLIQATVQYYVSKQVRCVRCVCVCVSVLIQATVQYYVSKQVRCVRCVRCVCVCVC